MIIEVDNLVLDLYLTDFLLKPFVLRPSQRLMGCICIWFKLDLSQLSLHASSQPHIANHFLIAASFMVPLGCPQSVRLIKISKELGCICIEVRRTHYFWNRGLLYILSEGIHVCSISCNLDIVGHLSNWRCCIVKWIIWSFASAWKHILSCSELGISPLVYHISVLQISSIGIVRIFSYDHIILLLKCQWWIL